ncbi:MAG TPA: hypothetical protein VM364_17265 [Vicinamibacterales bacterium]|nr:hypothetical protein [Vicinamibacterales bacterium]
MRRFALALVLVLAPAVAHAHVTVRDIVELTRAGLGEEILLALIEVHQPVFPVDSDTLKGLRDAGVPQKVIVAMVRSGRTPAPQPPPVIVQPPPPPAQPAPQVVVIEREEPRVREIAVPVPVYVPVRVHPPRPQPQPQPAEPVYWGFGGKLRPDAWRPTTVMDVQPDAKVPPPQKK